jgi:hypothetical protein
MRHGIELFGNTHLPDPIPGKGGKFTATPGNGYLVATVLRTL